MIIKNNFFKDSPNYIIYLDNYIEHFYNVSELSNVSATNNFNIIYFEKFN